MPLDTPTTSGPPAAYFPAEGDAIVVGIVDIGTYQQTDYDTGEPKKWPDGGPVEGKVITGLVISTSGTTCAGGEKASAPVAAGDIVTFWCEGGKHFTYKDALKAHGPIDRGDVMQWKRDADKPAKNARHNPQKVYTAKIRAPKADDGDIVARCEKAHRDLANVKALDAPAGPVGGDDEPF
tara:strand:+ start:46 stop:585 length:540 start_codon:yes stop_codon:yes gene_type:complete